MKLTTIPAILAAACFSIAVYGRGGIGIGPNITTKPATGGGVPSVEGNNATQSNPILPPTTDIAPEPATQGRRPSVDEVLPKDPQKFQFTDTRITVIMAQMKAIYGIEFVNQYDFKDPFIKDTTDSEYRITMGSDKPLTAREALKMMNNSLLALGYTTVESVRRTPPVVVVTIVPSKWSAAGGTIIPVFFGNDPRDIPVGDSIRTQVFTLEKAEYNAVHEGISTILGEKPDVYYNPQTRQLTVTASGTNVRSVAVVIQLLERQAPGTPR